MKDSPTKKLVKTPFPFLSPDAPQSDLVMTSRLRLARNLDGVSFANNTDEKQLTSILTQVNSAFSNNEVCDVENIFAMQDLDEIDRAILFERRLISPEFRSAGKGSGLVLGEKCTFSLMVNEEDHLRMQVIAPGLQLHDLWESMNRIDDGLSRRLKFAFAEKLGYLTACPSNVGTGMRASVMLHLPAMLMSGQIEKIIHATESMGMIVRGAFGEGSKGVGGFFQLSNQTTLGESETGIIRRLETLVSRLVWLENNARIKLFHDNRSLVYDFIGRAYGSLKYAYTLTSEETMQHLSAIRLGVELNLLNHLTRDFVDRLIFSLQPGHLQYNKGNELTTEERDIARADTVRHALNS